MQVDRLPRTVRVVEVGPRDGLQNEPEIVPLDVKVAFIERLADAGLPIIEVGSFVRSDRVPQMADTEEVVRRLASRRSLSASVHPASTGARGLPAPALVALVPNRRGLERAMACGMRAVAVFTAASEAFAQANIGMTIAQSLDTFRQIVDEAGRSSITVRGYVSTAWWCPYAGRVEPDTVRRVALALLEMGCDEIGIADTVGAATPAEVRALLERLLPDVPAPRLGVHFHDTRGTALANVLASLDMGITTVDASAGGLGGCPFAPGALGNLATEDLLYMLHGMAIETGANLETVRAASREMEAVLGRRLPSRYLQAGPPRATGASRSS